MFNENRATALNIWTPYQDDSHNYMELISKTTIASLFWHTSSGVTWDFLQPLPVFSGKGYNGRVSSGNQSMFNCPEIQNDIFFVRHLDPIIFVHQILSQP